VVAVCAGLGAGLAIRLEDLASRIEEHEPFSSFAVFKADCMSFAFWFGWLVCSFFGFYNEAFAVAFWAT
jgi:hypothetical protein